MEDCDQNHAQAQSEPQQPKAVAASEILQSTTEKKKATWSFEEDEILRSQVALLGRQHWVECAKLLPGRTGKQCRERWVNSLCPGLRADDWSVEEDATLANAVAVHGTKWAKICKLLPGRAENAIKNRYYAAIRRQDRKEKERPKSRHRSERLRPAAPKPRKPASLQPVSLKTVPQRALPLRLSFAEPVQSIGMAAPSESGMPAATTQSAPESVQPNHSHHDPVAQGEPAAQPFAVVLGDENLHSALRFRVLQVVPGSWFPSLPYSQPEPLASPEPLTSPEPPISPEPLISPELPISPEPPISPALPASPAQYRPTFAAWPSQLWFTDNCLM